MKTKSIFITISLVSTLFFSESFAQVGIKNDGTSPDPSSMLEVKSTDKGFLMPRMTSAQRDAIPSPATGLIIYNTDVNLFQGYNGTIWQSVDFSSCAPAQPGSITGNPTPICNETGVAYSITTVTGATNYNWTMPPGANIESGQGTTDITVNFGSENGNVSVRAESNCGTSAYRDLAITLQPPAQPGAISGNANPPCYAYGVAYSISPVTGATNYNWTVPANALVLSGQGTTNITVSFLYNNGNVSVRAESDCGNSAYSSLWINLQPPAQPGAITGLTSVCAGATGVAYSISFVPGAIHYNWTVPPGASIVGGSGDVMILVNFGSTSGNVSVTAQNDCGNSPTRNLAITVTPIPAQPGSITGTSTPDCQDTGVPYSIAVVSGATSYNWTVPPGATVESGQGTTNITVDFGTTSGNVSVRAENACGSSAYRNLAINMTPAQPGPISGMTSVCINDTEPYSIASVPGATGYNWLVPPGANVVSGQGTTNVVVHFGTTSGFVSVCSQNACGNSIYRNLEVTVVLVPVQPGSISGPTILDCEETGVPYSISSVPYATGYNWTVPPGAIVASGQNTTNIMVNFGTQSGNVGVRAQNSCGNSSYRYLSVNITPPEMPGMISGPINVDPEETGVNYSISPVPAADTYNWTVPPGASVVSGQGTTNITVDFGTQSGYVSVRAQNACGIGPYRDLYVMVGSASK